jgi:hypothetical protein
MTDTRNINALARMEIRAAAHAVAPALLRRAQLWQDHVKDHEVALIMYAIEQGTVLYRNRAGRWIPPVGSPVTGYGHAQVNRIVNEMIRTGLLRHVVDREGDHLVPALVHLKDGAEGAWHSACLFTGEDLGPMRARLVDELYLVDCLECTDVVARGHARGL